MSASWDELLTAAILVSKSGRWPETLSENVGRGVSLSAMSAIFVISATLLCVDFEQVSVFRFSADIAEVTYFADFLVLMSTPDSLAFWNNVLMVMPKPCELRHLSYCLSHSA